MIIKKINEKVVADTLCYDGFNISYALISEGDYVYEIKKIIEENLKYIEESDINNPVSLQKLVKIIYNKFNSTNFEPQISIQIVIELKNKFYVVNQGAFKAYRLILFDEDEEKYQSFKAEVDNNEHKIDYEKEIPFLPVVYELPKFAPDKEKNERIYYIFLNMYFSYTISIDDLCNVISYFEEDNQDLEFILNNTDDVLLNEGIKDTFFLNIKKGSLNEWKCL